MALLSKVRVSVQDAIRPTQVCISVKITGMWRVHLGLALVRLGVKIAGFKKTQLERVK